MSHLFCQFVVAAFLLFSTQQDATPPVPSVADAARAARENKQSSKPKHVWTDDEISPKAGFAAAGFKESEIRAEMYRMETIPQVPTVTSLEQHIQSFSALSSISAAKMSADYKQGFFAQHEKTPFPGQKEWEDQMETAIEHLIEEAGPAASRLKAILEENRVALSRGDTAASQKVREQWIEALIPHAAWQMRIHQLWLDGEERIKASSSKPQPH